MAIEACGSGTPDLSCSSMFLGYMGIYRRKKSVGGAMRGPRGWRARPGGGHAPYLVASSTLPWLALQVPGRSFVPKITFPKVLGYMDLYRRKKSVGGATRGHESGGRAQGGGCAPLSRGFLEASLACTPSSLDCFCSKNNAPEGFIPFGLRLIFLFFETLK